MLSFPLRCSSPLAGSKSNLFLREVFGEVWENLTSSSDLSFQSDLMPKSSADKLRYLSRASHHKVTEPDKSVTDSWKVKGSKNWPFWVHESCMSESYEHAKQKLSTMCMA